MQSNENSKSSRRTRLLFGSDSSRNSSHNANLKKHTDSVESNNLPPPPPPPPRYPLKGDGFSPHTGYGISSASGEQTPKSPPRTSSLRPRGIPLKREYGSRERIAQPATYGTGERKSLRKPQIGSSTTSNNSSSERQFPVVDRPSRPFTLTTTNTTNTSTASTNTTPSASSSNEKLTSIAITKHKVDSLCQTDPRSTPLLSRLLAPGFATSVVSSTINTNSNQRKGSFQSCGSSESDRSPVPSSSTARDLLTEMNRREMGLEGHSLSQGLTSSGEYQKKDGENVSWNSPSSSTHVQSTNRDWRELTDWSGGKQASSVVQSKNRSPNFQPSPDSQCWRTVTSVHITNENMLQQSSSNTCSSGTQDEMESSIDSPGVFNRHQCDVGSNDQEKMFSKGEEFSTNASSSGDIDDGDDDDDGGVDDDDDGDDRAIHQTPPPPNEEDIESDTHNGNQEDDNNNVGDEDDNDDEDDDGEEDGEDEEEEVEEGIDGEEEEENDDEEDVVTEDDIDNDDDTPNHPGENDETETTTIATAYNLHDANNDNDNDDDDNNNNNNNSVTMMMMIHRTSHSYVNESEELFAVHEQHERQLQQRQQQQQEEEEEQKRQHHLDHHNQRHHHHHQQQQQQHLEEQIDSKPSSHFNLPSSLQKPCDYDRDCIDYSNHVPSGAGGNVDSEGMMPPPPPPPPPYKIPDHLQPFDEPVFMNNPWTPPNYPLYHPYPQLPYPRHQHHCQSKKISPMEQFDPKRFVTSSVSLTKSPTLPTFDNPYDLLYMKQNCLPESFPPPLPPPPAPPGALIPRRLMCSQSQEELSGLVKNDAMPPFTAISQAFGFPIQWCYRGVCMLPRFPVTCTPFNNLPVSCGAAAAAATVAAFVLTTTTSHICSLAAAAACEYNASNKNNNNNNTTNNNNTQNQPFVGNYQPDMHSGAILGPHNNKPELFPPSKSNIPFDPASGGFKNFSEVDFVNLLKENQQLKQRLVDISARLQYIDELEWHVQRLSLLVESMIVSHQRQCELDYQLQIYSPISSQNGAGMDFDCNKPSAQPPPAPPPPLANSSSLSSSSVAAAAAAVSPFGPIDQLHNMPANPGSLPAMPTNMMTNYRTNPYIMPQCMNRRVTQPNIMPSRFHAPHVLQQVQQQQQSEKSEQRIPMANSNKRSIDPRTVSLDRASQPRNTCTAYNDIGCSCIRCPLHEVYPPYSRDHAYVNTTKNEDIFSMPNIPVLNSNNANFSPSYRRRLCPVRTTQIPPLISAAHLIPHSSLFPGSPAPRVLSTSNPICSNKPLSHPAIKITEENIRNRIPKESTQSGTTGNNNNNSNSNINNDNNNSSRHNNRPTGLNFMTEKSDIFDDSNMLLRHLSPHNEIHCVNTCTVVTSYHLDHCYPLCVVDRVPASGINCNNNNNNNNDIRNEVNSQIMEANTDNTITTTNNNNNNTNKSNTSNLPQLNTNSAVIATTLTVTSATQTTTSTVTPASKMSTTTTSLASSSSLIKSSKTNAVENAKQSKEKVGFTQPRSTASTATTGRLQRKSLCTTTAKPCPVSTHSTGHPQQQQQQPQQQQQRKVSYASTKRTKQTGSSNGSGSCNNNNKNKNSGASGLTIAAASLVSSIKKITSSVSTSVSSPKALDKIMSTVVNNRNSDNPDADYSGSYEGVSNSNSSHQSQSSEASSLEPDSTLSEGLLTRKCCSVKHSTSELKIPTCSSVSSCIKNQPSSSSTSKISIIPELSTSPRLSSSSHSTNTSVLTSLHTLVTPLRSTITSVVAGQISTYDSNTTNSNIVIPSVYINSPTTTLTPCHSIDSNSMLAYPPTSPVCSYNFPKKPNIMIMTTSKCTGSHLPTPISHTTVEQQSNSSITGSSSSNSQTTFVSNICAPHRSMINIRPSSLLTIPQKPSLQVRFTPPTRMNPCNINNNNNNNSNNNNSNKRSLLSSSVGSPILDYSSVNQNSSVINSIVSPNLLRKQYYYYK